MNHFLITLAFQLVAVAAYIWTTRVKIRRGEPLDKHFPASDTITGIQKGIAWGSMYCWIYFGSFHFRVHSGSDMAFFAFGEALVFVMGFSWGLFITKATWPMAIAAVAAGASYFAFVWIMIDATR